MFTITLAIMNAASAVIGVMVDTVGPRVATLFGLVLSCVGFVLMANADSVNFDVFVLSFALIGSGGIGPYFAHFNFSNLFRKYQGIFISVVTGLFNISGLNFYWLFSLAGPLLRSTYGLSSEEVRYYVFIVYAVLAGACMIVVALLYPDRAYHDGDVCVLPVQTAFAKCTGTSTVAAPTATTTATATTTGSHSDGGGVAENLEAGGAREPSKSVMAAAGVSLPSSPAGAAAGSFDDSDIVEGNAPDLHLNTSLKSQDSLDSDCDLIDTPRSMLPDDDDAVFDPRSNEAAAAAGEDKKPTDPKFHALTLIKHSLKRLVHPPE